MDDEAHATGILSQGGGDNRFRGRCAQGGNELCSEVWKCILVWLVFLKEEWEELCFDKEHMEALCFVGRCYLLTPS